MIKIKSLKRAMLGAVTFFCPVFLAACYGPPNREWEDPSLYDLEGTVVDAETKAAIPGIGVFCKVCADFTGSADTAEDGSFDLLGGKRCEALVFTDVDGAGNGGIYEEKLIETVYYEDGSTVELTRLTP